MVRGTRQESVHELEVGKLTVLITVSAQLILNDSPIGAGSADQGWRTEPILT